MSEWIGAVNVTAPKYLKGASDNTIRGRFFLKMLEQKGRFEFNQNSFICNWDVEFAHAPVESYGDAGLITFNRNDLYRQLNIDWRGYIATDMMYMKESLINQGDVAIVDRYGRIVPNLTKGITNRFGQELFTDGSLSTTRIHGLETFMGAGACGAADRVAVPAGAYGGRSTALAAEGGSWSTTLGVGNFPNATIATDWPDGNSSTPEYDFMSPKLVNITSTGWGTGSTKWEDNCERVLNQTTIWLTRTTGVEGRPTMYLMSGDLFYGYRNKVQALRRVIVPHREAEDLGFPDVLNVDGVAIQTDFDVPSGSFYGINVYQMQVASMNPELFFTKGPDYSPKDLGWLFLVGFFGNCRYSPKYFAKGKAYA